MQCSNLIDKNYENEKRNKLLEIEIDKLTKEKIKITTNLESLNIQYATITNKDYENEKSIRLMENEIED